MSKSEDRAWPVPPSRCPHEMAAVVAYGWPVPTTWCGDCGCPVRLAVSGATGGYLQAVGEPNEILLDQGDQGVEIRWGFREGGFTFGSQGKMQQTRVFTDVKYADVMSAMRLQGYDETRDLFAAIKLLLDPYVEADAAMPPVLAHLAKVLDGLHEDDKISLDSAASSLKHKLEEKRPAGFAPPPPEVYPIDYRKRSERQTKRIEHLQGQIDRLASCILERFPEAIDRSEGACDTAVRLLHKVAEGFTEKEIADAFARVDAGAPVPSLGAYVGGGDPLLDEDRGSLPELPASAYAPDAVPLEVGGEDSPVVGDAPAPLVEVEMHTGKVWQLLRPEDPRVIDPDGWRMSDGVLFDSTPIELEDYQARLNKCTTGPADCGMGLAERTVDDEDDQVPF